MKGAVLKINYGENYLPGIVLSRKKPKHPATNIPVLSKMLIIWSKLSMPSLMAPLWSSIHWEMTSPKKMEKPMMKIFLAEFKSTPWRFESPTAVTVAKTTQNIPPTIGSGMQMKAAPNLPISENTIIKHPAAWITRLDPTFVTLIAPIFSLYEVVPLEVPKMPASTHPIPSMKIPRLIACFGGALAPTKFIEQKVYSDVPISNYCT